MQRLSQTFRFVPIGILIAICILATLGHQVSATSSTLWGPKADNPDVKVINDDFGSAPSAAVSPCHDHDFVLQVSDDNKYPFRPHFGDEAFSQCAFYTSFGLVGVNGIFQFNNAAQPYLSDFTDGIMMTPNSRSLFAGSSNGIVAYDDPASDFQLGPGADYATPRLTYKNEYHFKSGAERRVLKDSAGNAIQGLGHMGASQNGKWLIVQRGEQLLRVRQDDFNDLLAFAGTAWQFPGTYGDPSDQLAISNDGRYVALAGGDGQTLKLYDLSSCKPDPTYNLNNAANCAPIDMVSFLQSHLQGYLISVDQPGFSWDSTQLYLNVRVQLPNGDKHRGLIDLITAGATYEPISEQSTNYIALGDSFASGEGAFDYFSGTDEKDNKCHLSKRSYPYLLGSRLQLDDVHSVACSGAKMVNVNGYGNEAAQHTTVATDAYSSYWLPGYKPQLRFIEDKQPNIVTISMGGNDIDFSDIIKRCILFDDTCYSDYAGRMGLVENIDNKFDSLVMMYTQIKANAAPDARIYVVGYPSIVQPDGNCGDNVRLNSNETEFASELADYLDYVIKLAATKAGVQYVDTEGELDPYRLCSSVSNVRAFNGLTAGNDNLHIIGDESYHPNAVGHQLMAHAIDSETDDMTEPSPAPDWSIGEPDVTNASDLLDVPNTGQMVREIEMDDDKFGPFLIGGVIGGSLENYKYHLDHETSYQVWLHSTPIELGTAMTDESGNLNYSFQIPKNIEPGWHTIDVYGEDITGQPVDIQRIIYIAVSASDWDGDGIPNDKEPCGLIPPSGVDADHDGIDDACDGVIGSLQRPDNNLPGAAGQSIIQSASSLVSLSQAKDYYLAKDRVTPQADDLQQPSPEIASLSRKPSILGARSAWILIVYVAVIALASFWAYRFKHRLR